MTRFRVTWVGASAMFVVGTVACTRLLGIDEDYTLATGEEAGAEGTDRRREVARGEPAGSGADAGHDEDAAAMTPPVTAKAEAEAGTRPGDGRASDSGLPDVVSTDGADPLEAYLPCRPGLYEGSFEGTHRPSATFVGVPLRVSGDVALRLEMRNATTMFVAQGTFDGTFDTSLLPAPPMQPVQPSPPFRARLVGTVDCETNEVELQFVEGTYTLTGTSVFDAAFTGHLQGTFDVSARTLSGTWSSVESNTTYAGDGSWHVSWVGQ